MSTSSPRSATTSGSTRDEPRPAPEMDRQLIRWGGIAAMAGAACLVASGIVVGAFGLPDASDAETLTDFADIESGRIAEHFLYLGAVMGFALHTFVLHRLLGRSHPGAALFGTVMSAFGLVIMAASSLLHVSTSPLADLYTDPDTTAGERSAIEYAWHGSQSVWDTMLATGVLLVPIGIVLLGIAMRHRAEFGARLPVFGIALGAIGIVGAAIAIIDPGSVASAAAVVAIAVFHLGTGWRTLTMADESRIDLTDTAATPTP